MGWGSNQGKKIMRGVVQLKWRLRYWVDNDEKDCDLRYEKKRKKMLTY